VIATIDNERFYLRIDARTPTCNAQKSNERVLRRSRWKSAWWYSGIKTEARRAAMAELRCKSYARSQPTSRNWSNPAVISPSYRPRELQIRARTRTTARWIRWARCWVLWEVSRTRSSVGREPRMLRQVCFYRGGNPSLPSTRSHSQQYILIDVPLCW
jgi:hypothetical protein